MADRRFTIMAPWNLKVREERDQGVIAIVLWIPWSLIAPHEAQAKSNHGQSLERLDERGGLTADEAVAVLEDRPWHRMPRAESNARLLELMAEHSRERV
jgi:hypothetical protein